MKNRPDQQDDFFSSAGVPTIPLRAKPTRANDSLIVYGALVICFLVLTCIEYVVGFEVIQREFAVYELPSVVIGLILVVIGFALKQKWVLLVGLTVISSSIGLYFGALTGTVSLPLALLIMLLIYRWYLMHYHLESSAWPLMVGVLCGVAGILLLLTHLGVLGSLIVPLVLMCASVALFVLQWRRI